MFFSNQEHEKYNRLEYKNQLFKHFYNDL